VSDDAFNKPGLNTYRDAIRNGTSRVDLVAKNASPVSFDSLTKAVRSGAKHIYSELTGGDHRSGWMIAWHHPLLAEWMFSKSKAGTSVALARKSETQNGLRAHRALSAYQSQNGWVLQSGDQRLFNPLGKAIPSHSLQIRETAAH
jgi:hypothetical protein